MTRAIHLTQIVIVQYIQKNNLYSKNFSIFYLSITLKTEFNTTRNKKIFRLKSSPPLIKSYII